MKKIIIFVIAVLGGFLGAFLFDKIPVSQNQLIADFYASETAVMVSPHGLRKKMMKGDKNFVLVDVRSEEEYELEHIVGALNVPAYKDPYTSAYGDVERITNSFREIINENPNKNVIVYCYSTPCMTGRKVGNMLAKNSLYVKELGVGWNEWRYDWNAWNHAHEWGDTRVEDYVKSGSEPGDYEVKEGELAPCAIDNEFGC